MASIDELIANSGKTDPRMWEAAGNIPKAYYEGQDQAYKQKMRNVFSDENGGLLRDAKGNVDFQKAYERLVTVGGAPAIDAAGSLATSGLTQDRIRFAPQAAETLSTADQPPAAAPGASTGDFTLDFLTGEIYADIAVKHAREIKDPAFVSFVLAAIYFKTARGLIAMGGCEQGFLGRVARLAYVGSLN